MRQIETNETIEANEANEANEARDSATTIIKAKCSANAYGVTFFRISILALCLDMVHTK